MTQEDKELLLKDLCARLPYGVKVQSTFYKCDGTIWKYENEILTVGLLEYSITRYKPYLFPLSSMTEEQYKELWDRLDEDYKETLKRANAGQKCANPYTNVADWYNKNHFDYRGLIPIGLANDATGLNIY